MDYLRNFCGENAKLIPLMIAILVIGSIKQILVPLLTIILPSLYFIVIVTMIEGFIVYTIILFAIHMYKYNRISCGLPNNIHILILIGISTGLMAMCLTYAANPIRTPVVIQSVFLGLVIIPSVIFTYFILHKSNKYEFKYIIPSILFLLLSIGIAIIPIINSAEMTIKNVLWVGLYLSGIILLGLANVLQEKYITLMTSSFENNIRLTFYASIFQIITVLCLCWIDPLFGYSNTPSTAFYNFTLSFEMMFTDVTTLLITQLFTAVCIVLFLLSVYLNAISTNYNMILNGLTNQSVALFFTIFPHFNTGIKYPLYIVIPSLLCCLISVILWLKGEHKINKNYEETYLLTNKNTELGSFNELIPIVEQTV